MVKSSAIVIETFIGKFPDVQPPRHETIYELNKRIEETGTVDDLPRSGRPKTALTDENLQIVAEALVFSPHKLIREASVEFDITSSWQRSLKKLKLKTFTYKPQPEHALHEDKPDRRVEFCSKVMAILNSGRQFCG
jgi:transposase